MTLLERMAAVEERLSKLVKLTRGRVQGLEARVEKLERDLALLEAGTEDRERAEK